MVSAAVPYGLCIEPLAQCLKFGLVGFFGDEHDGCSHKNKKQWGGGIMQISDSSCVVGYVPLYLLLISYSCFSY